MDFTPLSLSDAYVVDLEPRGDERGSYTRLFCANEFRQIGLTKPLVNINHSYSRYQGTIRGIHFQYHPDSEIKIVKCIRGAIWDCIVDIRRDSPTFLKWDAVELSADNSKMIYIPEGFAHGFQALTDNVEIIYFVTAFYAPNNEDGLRFDDPALKINWPLPATVVAERSRKHKLITERTNWNGVWQP